VYQTKLQRRTLSPIYDESFDLKLTPLTPEHRLHFDVFDFDRYSRHDLIGSAVLQPHSPDVTSERLHVLNLVVEKQVSFYIFLPRDASAERGNATVSRPSVCLSVRP